LKEGGLQYFIYDNLEIVLIHPLYGDRSNNKKDKIIKEIKQKLKN
jgi:hypothetical protein